MGLPDGSPYLYTSTAIEQLHRTLNDNEPELLLRLARNDEKAYTAIIEQYGSIIYGHCLMYVKDAGLAEEITQDINVYYFQHESVDDLQIEIVEVTKHHIVTNVTGKGIINGSNGNHPDAEFLLHEVTLVHDPKLKRGVM